jgi:hypothetical protein
MVTEMLPSGWALESLVCTDPDNGTTVNLGTRRATIDLDAGETVTCTFTNTRFGVSLFTLQGAGVCLTLDLAARQYSFKTPRGTFTGPLVSGRRGNVLWFENRRGDNKLMRAWINLVNRTASAVLILPRLLGGGRFILNDPNIGDNAPCL